MIYIYFAIIFVVVFFTIISDHKDYGTFMSVGISVVQKIFHPEYYNGEFFSIKTEEYIPFQNYPYFVAFIAEKIGYEKNLWELGRIFWFFEKGLSLVIMVMLCNLIFPRDKITLLITGTLFVSFLDHEATQKSLSWLPYLLAIYYFLKERWLISGIFSASIFYLHIGAAVWWIGTAGFALLAMLFIQKRVSSKQVMGFFFATILFSSPIIYFYIRQSLNSEIDGFSVQYLYYAHLWQTSPLLALVVTPLIFANQWLTLAMFYMGYSRARKDGYDYSNILLLVIGALALYFMQFIFADIFSSNFIIPMQLTRASARIALVFGSIFTGYLLASHLRKGNYFFLLIFMFMYLTHRTYKTIFASIIILIFYEIFERHIKEFVENIFSNLKVNIDFLRKKIKARSDKILQQPVVVALVLLIFFAGDNLTFSQSLKSYIKSVLHISKEANTIGVGLGDKNKSLYEDVAKYFNEEVANKKALILYPFLKTDFPIFVPRHDSFISATTPIYNMYYNMKGSDEFKAILENDLNYSLERLFRNRANNAKVYYDRWDEMWRGLDEDIISYWKGKYDLTHVVREKEQPLNFPIVYKNPFYAVYEIK